MFYFACIISGISRHVLRGNNIQGKKIPTIGFALCPVGKAATIDGVGLGGTREKPEVRSQK
jgi:hypothetical protein